MYFQEDYFKNFSRKLVKHNKLMMLSFYIKTAHHEHRLCLVCYFKIKILNVKQFIIRLTHICFKIF